MIKKKICPDCKKEFDFDTLARFKKKYCPKCSTERKEAYERIHEISIERVFKISLVAQKEDKRLLSIMVH